MLTGRLVKNDIGSTNTARTYDELTAPSASSRAHL